MNQEQTKGANNKTLVQDCTFRMVIPAQLDWFESGTTVAFGLSPNGRYIFTAGLGNRIGQWNRASGRPIRYFQHSANAVNVLLVSPDGRYLFAGRNDGRIDQWNLERGELFNSFEGHKGEVAALILSGDCRYLYSGGEQEIFEWDTVTGDKKREFTAHTDTVKAFALSFDGNYLYSGGLDNQIIRWDLKTGIPMRFEDGHSDGIRCLCLSPDGHSLYCGGYASYLSQWNPAEGSLQRIIEGCRGLAALCFSPDGRYLYGSDADGTYVLDLDNGEEMEWLCYEGGYSLFYDPEEMALYSGVWRVDISTKMSEEWFEREMWDARAFIPTHDNWALFSIHRRRVLGESVLRWNLFAGEKECYLRNLDGLAALGDLVVSDNNRYLSFCSKRFKTLIQYDLHQPGVPFRKLPADGDVYVFTTDSSRVYTSKQYFSENKKAVITEWNWHTGDKIREFHGHSQGIHALTQSSDGRYLYSGGADYQIIQWDLSTGEMVRAMKVQGLVIEQLVVSPDGQYLYSRTMDGIREWHEGEENLIANCFGTFTLSPDGRFLYYQFRGAMMRWDCRERRETRLWDEKPSSLRLIASDKLLYCGREDGSITIYNIGKGRTCFTLYNLDQGFLLTAPDEAGESGYFWTDRPDLIAVTEVDSEGNPRRFLMPDEAETRAYIEAHNRQELVMKRIKQVMSN